MITNSAHSEFSVLGNRSVQAGPRKIEWVCIYCMMVPAGSVLGAVAQTSTSESKAYLCQSKAQNSATFRLALQIYIPMSAEFPDAETILGSYEDAIPSFAMRRSGWTDYQLLGDRAWIGRGKHMILPQNRHTQSLSYTVLVYVLFYFFRQWRSLWGRSFRAKAALGHWHPATAVIPGESRLKISCRTASHYIF